jgi:hypothetical protein
MVQVIQQLFHPHISKKGYKLEIKIINKKKKNTHLGSTITTPKKVKSLTIFRAILVG